MKIEERSLYPPLMNSLKEVDFQSVSEVGVKGKYPDIVFYHNHEKFILQVKIGRQKKILDGLIGALDHARRANTDKVLVLVYPPEIRRPIITPKQVDTAALETEATAVVTTDYWNTKTKVKPRELFETLKEKVKAKKKETNINFTINVLREGLQEFSSILRTHSYDKIEDALNAVTGRFDLFLKLGKSGESESKELRSAAIDLMGYLLLDKILFYHVFSVKTNKLSELDESISNLSDLRSSFQKIREINYEAIYDIEIIPHLPKDERFMEVVQKIIKALKVIRPEHIKQDLLGRMFHNLLPHRTRKILAAFYTNPIAAEILAGLTVDEWNEKIIDPACGSGTLLSAAYHRKSELFNKTPKSLETGTLHSRFVEEEITGIDIMPFAVHLTGISLSSQEIKAKTNKLRTGVNDSLEITPHSELKPFRKKIQTDLVSFSHEEKEGKAEKVVEAKGAVSTEGAGGTFKIGECDSVIMNPPFTDREKMPEDYREKLKGKSENPEVERRISELLDKCGGQVNLWGYFLALGDDLVKKEGKIGAVLPINLFRGDATEEIRNYLFDNYKLKHIVKTTKELAFTEGADFRDVLAIFKKPKSYKSSPTAITFLKKSLNELNPPEARNIAEKIRNVSSEKEYEDEDIFTYWVNPDRIQRYKGNLMPLIGLTSIESRRTLNKFLEVLNREADKKLVKVKAKELKEGFGFRPAGLSQLIAITSPIDTSRIRRAFMIKEKKDKHSIGVKVKDGELSFEIDKDKLVPALRTLTGVKTIDISKNHDYIVLENFKKFDEIKMRSKWDSGLLDWRSLQEDLERFKAYVIIPDKLNLSSPNTHLISVASEREFVPSNLHYLIKVKNKKKAKAIALFFNSVVSFVEFLLYKAETLGTYTRMKMRDWSLTDRLNWEELSQEEKKKILETYEELKNTDFPSLKEQLESRFWAREKLDTIVLEVLGFKEEEIEKWLHRVYEAIIKELKKMKEM